MLIGFLGLPCSGKTTTAAKLFAELKETKYSVEFVVEEARKYIAQQRLCGLNKPVVLDDIDQENIANSQKYNEDLMESSSDKTIVITDSCVLNAELYMSEECSDSARNTNFMISAISRYTLLFMPNPIELPSEADPNRIHSKDQINKISSKIDNILHKYEIYGSVIRLYGNPQQRLQSALYNFLQLKPYEFLTF